MQEYEHTKYSGGPVHDFNEGERVLFHNHTNQNDPRNGTVCKIVEEIENSETDDPIFPRYVVEFEDGLRIDVRWQEIEHIKSGKPPNIRLLP
jgi:hypothetical protein